MVSYNTNNPSQDFLDTLQTYWSNLCDLDLPDAEIDRLFEKFKLSRFSVLGCSDDLCHGRVNLAKRTPRGGEPEALKSIVLRILPSFIDRATRNSGGQRG